MMRLASSPETDIMTISDSYYLIGICNLLSGNNAGAVKNLESALTLREKSNVFDVRYGRILYNLGLAHRGLGDYYKMEENELKSLDTVQEDPWRIKS